MAQVIQAQVVELDFIIDLEYSALSRGMQH
jgi:hypothetical protein